MSMTLSDPFCVDRYRDEFLDLMRSGTVDIVFANEHEAMSLYQTASLDSAVDALAADCRLAIITRGENGSIIATDARRTVIPAIEIDALVDTTGAGDLYAAGFLYGYTTGYTLEQCGHLGSLAAGLVIQQIGPRPMQSLRQAAIDTGLFRPAKAG
jgi:sugar/nucleoside kinase (ribokinase family)